MIYMSDTIIVALISGAITLFGTVMAILQTSKKTESAMQTNLAVMKSEIEELRREVREHNNFARRMPVVEEKVTALENRVAKVEQK